MLAEVKITVCCLLCVTRLIENASRDTQYWTNRECVGNLVHNIGQRVC